jgi:hypothetical protein
VLNPTRKALPWATAAGAVALVAGTIAGQAGAGAATASPASAPAVKAAAVNALGVPAGAVAQANAQLAAAKAPGVTGHTIAAPAAAPAAVKASKASKATKPATPTMTAAGYKYFDSGFILRLRAAAIEVEPDIPHPLVPGAGYSAVNIEKDIGGPEAKCEIFGAGAYFTDVVQEGVLENSGPPDAGNKGGGIFNPTEAKDTSPNLSPGENLNARKPQIRDVTDGHSLYDIPAGGNGVRWEAHCDNDAGGKGIGNIVDVAGAQSAGSTTVGHINKETGEYIGQSRAFVAGLETGSGTLDFVASLTQIKHLPGQEPTVSYSIGAAGGTLASGANVPAADLTKQFNDQVKNGSAALSALGPMGVTLMGPTVTESENGHRPIINMPFFDVSIGLTSREGQVGQNQHARLVNIDYEGQYTQ